MNLEEEYNDLKESGSLKPDEKFLQSILSQLVKDILPVSVSKKGVHGGRYRAIAKNQNFNDSLMCLNGRMVRLICDYLGRDYQDFKRRVLTLAMLCDECVTNQDFDMLDKIRLRD